MIIRLAIIRFLLWWVILPSVTMRVVLVRRKGFPEGFSVIDAGSVSSQNTSGSAWANTMISMFGRVMYSYADRYMLSASVVGTVLPNLQMETAGAHSRLYLWVGM